MTFSRKRRIKSRLNINNSFASAVRLFRSKCSNSDTFPDERVISEDKEDSVSDPFAVFAQYVWPFFRSAIRLPRRCDTCVTLLQDDDPDTCALCRGYVAEKSEVSPRPFVIEGGDQLLLLLSGGKDGIYVLGRLREEYPNIPIACVLVDTGFLGPRALQNAQAATERLRVDFRVVRSYIGQFRIVLREAFCKLKRNPSASCYGVVDYAEGNLIFDIGIRLAKESRQRIVSGLTSSQLALIDAPIKKVPGALFPLDTWRPREEEILVAARRIAGKGSRFGPLDTNSTLILLMSALDILRNGFCGFEPEFSKNIREGVSDRTCWLHRFEALKWLVENGFLDRCLDESLASLDLERKDVLS